MKVWIGVLVVVGVVAWLEAASVGEGAKTAAAERLEEILKHVQKKDIKEFVRYHLQKGHDLVKQKEEDAKYPGFNYNIEDEDSILFYEYFATNNQVEDETTAEVARNIICWKDKCIDISDPGVHP